MSNNQVAVVNQVLTAEQQGIRAALPTHIKPEKFMQICATAAMVNPDLQACTHSSLAKSFIQSAKDGLIPDGKEAAIVIYNKKQGNVWIKEAQYQPMVDGILKRLRQSGEVPYITAKPVYEGDEFDYYMDMEGEKLHYRPRFQDNKDENIKLFFAMAKLRTGEAIVEVMTKDEVDNIMFSSKSAIDKDGKLNPYSVWAKFYSRMGLKTVIHRIAKRLPNSSEVMEMIERDIQLKEMKNGVYAEDKSDNQTETQNVQTISKEDAEQLRKMVMTSGSNEQQMFSFISSKSGRIVNSYKELDQTQYQTLLQLIEKKIADNVVKQREADMANQEAMQGELMPSEHQAQA
ncbi:hypothetical protein JCM30760_26650 [Thiomicrorhabdus hydrogeniphila]